MARLLLVDDEMAILIIMRALFKANGHDVLIANSSQQAIEALLAQHVDLVITDVRMAPVDGFEVLETIKKKHPDVVVIMITAYYSEAAKARAVKLGAKGYLRKPFDNDELLKFVNKVLAEKKNADAKRETPTGN